MPTRRFLQLSRRIRELEQNLLPPVSPVGSYTREQYDRVRGFRLLAHAEIESFIEDRARDLVNQNVQAWKQDLKPRRLLLSILAFHLRGAELSAQRLKAVYAQASTHTHDCVVHAQQDYNALLGKNHGIREENILRMLMPLGLDASDIDSVWLATTDAFGSKRGETAHTTIAVQRPLDPVSEKKTVTDVLAGLIRLDARLSTLR